MSRINAVMEVSIVEALGNSVLVFVTIDMIALLLHAQLLPSSLKRELCDRIFTEHNAQPSKL